MNSPTNGQIGGLKMQDASSTDVKRRRRRRHHEETPIETVGGELRVWRDRGTNAIVIEPPVFAPKKRLISLSARHARHLASSLLLFAAEMESSPAFTAATSPDQVTEDAEGDESNRVRAQEAKKWNDLYL
jgi:hypothetical protein